METSFRTCINDQSMKKHWEFQCLYPSNDGTQWYDDHDDVHIILSECVFSSDKNRTISCVPIGSNSTCNSKYDDM